MSNSTLLALVGNDSQRADELVTVIAGLVRSCLAAIREEAKKYDNVIESSSGTSESDSSCLHTYQH